MLERHGNFEKGMVINMYNYTDLIKINEAKEILIFGVRIVSREVSTCLMGNPFHKNIKAFIVSDGEPHPSTFMERDVMEITEAIKSYDKNILICIACMEKNIDIITSNLHKGGFENLVPLTFESDIWAEIRWLYYLENGKERGIKILSDYLHEKKIASANDVKEIAVFNVQCHVDKILTENMQKYSWEIPIQVGSVFTEKDVCAIKDNSGDNISDKNKKYCELTGIYWIWKNYNADYVGISHYRRHFELTESMLSQIAHSDIDVIVTIPIFNFPSVREVYREDHCIDDWYIMLEAIEKISPEYLLSARNIGNGNYYFAYNMMIAKQSIYNEYCEWLFSILEYCEKYCVKKDNVYQDRYIGFLAERLLTIYLEKHKNDYNILIARKHFVEK